MHEGPPFGENGAPGEGPDPEQTDRALGELLERWRQEDPEGYAAFVTGDAARFPPAAGHTATPARRGRSGRLLAAILVVVLVYVVARFDLVDRLVDGAYGLAGEPGAHLAQTVAPARPGPPPPGQPGRLAAAVPVSTVPPASTWAFSRTQGGGSAEPVRWDPCRPIHYVVREHPPVGDRGRDVIRRAVAEVSAATGLVFVDDGFTDEAPDPDRRGRVPGRYGDGWAPVLIAWSDPTESPSLAGDTIGRGGGVSVRAPDGRAVYVSGQIVLDSPSMAKYLGFLAHDEYATAVVMHELGHVVGADHPAATDQLMSAENVGRTEWNDGDRYVLAVLGQGRCENVG